MSIICVSTLLDCDQSSVGKSELFLLAIFLELAEKADIELLSLSMFMTFTDSLDMVRGPEHMPLTANCSLSIMLWMDWLPGEGEVLNHMGIFCFGSRVADVSLALSPTLLSSLQHHSPKRSLLLEHESHRVPLPHAWVESWIIFYGALSEPKLE